MSRESHLKKHRQPNAKQRIEESSVSHESRHKKHNQSNAKQQCEESSRNNGKSNAKRGREESPVSRDSRFHKIVILIFRKKTDERITGSF